MKYTNTLILVYDNDKKTSKVLKPLLEDVDASFYRDIEDLDDEPFMQKIGESHFLVLSRNADEVIIEYFTGGKSIKSCPQKIKLTFDTSNTKIRSLCFDKPTKFDATDKYLYAVKLLKVEVFSCKRDSVDPNQIIQTFEGSFDYYLRKNINGIFALETAVTAPNKSAQISLFNKIHPFYHSLLKNIIDQDNEMFDNPDNDLNDFDDLEELFNMKELLGDDYQDPDEYDEDYLEEDIETLNDN